MIISKKIYWIIWVAVIQSFFMAAQTDSIVIKHPADLFRYGRTTIDFRNYTMATVNQDSLRDYVANALGVTMGFSTASYKGFSANVSFQMAMNVFDNQLGKADAATGKRAVWETELFDVNHPNEKYNLDRLETLNLQYQRAGWNIRLGKMDINKGPLFLSRNGRMKPFLFSGLYATYQRKEQHFYGGWLTGAAPRGMTEWYSINEVIGLKNNGFAFDGTKASYHKTVDSKGIGLLGWEGKYKSWAWKVWEFYFHNMMQTTWLETSYALNKWKLGVQYVFQSSLAAQERLIENQQFYHPDEQAHLLSAQLSYDLTDRLQGSAAWLHGFDTGRFIFPRELGRENFFVSQPRSWVDGFGQLSVYQIKLKYTIDKQFDGALRFSYWDIAAIDDYRFNKYGRTDYAQLTADIRYKGKDKLKGMAVRFLYVLRLSENEDLTPQDIFYRTNFHHLNLIINYLFQTKQNG